MQSIRADGEWVGAPGAGRDPASLFLLRKPKLKQPGSSIVMATTRSSRCLLVVSGI